MLDQFPDLAYKVAIRSHVLAQGKGWEQTAGVGRVEGSSPLAAFHT